MHNIEQITPIRYFTLLKGVGIDYTLPDVGLLLAKCLNRAIFFIS